MFMPNIKPISDLRNYTEVLKEVDASNRVYLTRNGHGEYGILTMDETSLIVTEQLILCFLNCRKQRNELLKKAGLMQMI